MHPFLVIKEIIITKELMMINTDQSQFKMDDFAIRRLTEEYKQFISDHKTVPSYENIKSNQISMMFVEKCYNTALYELKELSIKKTWLFSCYKYEYLGVSIIFPKELITSILQIYHQITDHGNLDFKQFHEIDFGQREIALYNININIKELWEREIKFLNFEDNEAYNYIEPGIASVLVKPNITVEERSSCTIF